MVDLKEIFSGKKSLVGLDIGSSSVKLAEIISNAKGYYLNRFHEVPLPKGIIIDGILADAPVLSSKIKELFKIGNQGFRSLALRLPTHRVGNAGGVSRRKGLLCQSKLYRPFHAVQNQGQHA